MPDKFSILKAKHLRLGRKGENIACRLLKNKGYDILHRNLKLNKIEVDIVARDGETLCFVEVKTRHYKKNYKNPDNKVWVRKQQTERIEKAGRRYIFKIGGQKLKYRFELIEIGLRFNSIISINHWDSDFGRIGSN